MLKIKKAQSGTKLTEMGKKTTKAAIDKRTDSMAKSLDKASVFGKNYVAPGDSANKKIAPKKKMQYGGEAASMVPSMKKGGSMKKGVSVKKAAMKKKK